MERNSRRDRTGEMVSMMGATAAQGQSGCPECSSPDPQVRATHQLGLARLGGLDLLTPHLYQHLVPRATSEARHALVESISAWVANVMQQWAGVVDEQTGALLPWWVARRQAMARRDAIALAAYKRAPGKFQAQTLHPGNLAPVLRRVLPREPGDDTASEAATS